MLGYISKSLECVCAILSDVDELIGIEVVTRPGRCVPVRAE